MKRGKGKRNERGGTLVLLMVALVGLGAATAALFGLENRRSSRATNAAALQRGFVLAESAIDEVAVLLNANAFTAQSVVDWAGDGIDNDGDGLVDEGDETVFATAALWGSDGIDNDGDLQIDEDDEQVARVDSSASIGVSTRQVTGFLRRGTLTLPVPPAAVYLDDPNANVNFAGNAFAISGNDTNLNGTPGPGPSVYGIAINGDPQQVVSQLSGQQQNNVTGTGGYPSVTNYTPPAPDFIQAVVTAYAPLAQITFPQGSSNFSGALGVPPTGPSWNNGSYAITYSGGNLNISGTSSGAGILLVQGNLEISGDWNYVGYVFVTGHVHFKGGGGTKKLQGALFAGVDVVQGSSGSTFTVNGTVDILYSTEALAIVQDVLGQWIVAAVVES